MSPQKIIFYYRLNIVHGILIFMNDVPIVCCIFSLVEAVYDCFDDMDAMLEEVDYWAIEDGDEAVNIQLCNI